MFCRVIARPLRALVAGVPRAPAAKFSSDPCLPCGGQMEITPTQSLVMRDFGKHKHQVDEEFDQRFIDYFNRSDIDGWEVRHAMNELAQCDCVADPKIICAALRACRRLNDYALTTRFLESVKDKCGGRLGEFYPYIMQEIGPTLKELGINTPEEMGYDKPELALKSVYDD